MHALVDLALPGVIIDDYSSELLQRVIPRSHIAKLDLEGCELRGGPLHRLSAAFASAPNLRRVMLGANKIDDRDAQPLAEVIADAVGLNTVNLGTNRFSAVSCTVLAPALAA